MSVHASQAFSIAHCTDSEDLPKSAMTIRILIVIRSADQPVRRSAFYRKPNYVPVFSRSPI